MLRAVAFLAIATFVAPEIARASTSYVVDSVLDAVDDNVNDTVCHTADNTCTLRAAIMQANHYTGSGNVAITLPAGTYVLSIAIAGANGDDSGDLNLTATPAGNSTVTITLSPPQELVAGTVNASQAWVLGVQPSYPAA